MNRPKIVITMSDDSGIGSEVIMKALDHLDVYTMCAHVVVGDAQRLEEAGKIVHSNLEVRLIDDIDKADVSSA